MSLLRIATVNALESATGAGGNADPDYPLARLTDRNNAREMRARSVGVVTGGVKTTYGAYTVHTFLGSGTLVVAGMAAAIAADVLVVGGGGGGSTGGGGAGGMVVGTQGLSGSMAVYVGAGGSGVNGNGTPGTNGAPGGTSSIGAVSAAGGGGGGGAGANGTAGGSSGGGGYSASATTTSPAVSPVGQGNTGGGNAGITALPYAAGGGGGALNVGANAGGGGSAGGAGGAGTTNALRTGSNITYAGGGGGATYGNGTPGAGGAGGGGAANDDAGNGTAGTANTGGGGGGAGNARTGGSGGMGIVVVRYLTAALDTGLERVFTWGPGMAAIDVNALIIPAGHTVGGMAYTLARSGNGTDWTTVSSSTFAAGTGIIVLEFATVSPDYWRLTLPNDAAVSMAEMLLTYIYTVARNPARPSGVLQTDYNVKKSKTSAGSARFIEYGPPSRQRNYDFNNASTMDTTALLTRTAALGMVKPFFLCDHEGSWIWGALEEPIAPVEISYSRRKFSFNFREVLG